MAANDEADCRTNRSFNNIGLDVMVGWSSNDADFADAHVFANLESPGSLHDAAASAFRHSVTNDEAEP